MRGSLHARDDVPPVCSDLNVHPTALPTDVDASVAARRSLNESPFRWKMQAKTLGRTGIWDLHARRHSRPRQIVDGAARDPQGNRERRLPLRCLPTNGYFSPTKGCRAIAR
jgi:hypothetical protein